jgi:hypothetical protein
MGMLHAMALEIPGEHNALKSTNPDWMLLHWSFPMPETMLEFHVIRL